MRDALQLRHQLIPYLYTMAWRNTTEGSPLITPLYYEHPEDEAAYHCRQEYRFGSELLVAPFTSPIDPDTRLSRQQVWLPAGEWYNFFTADHYTGDRWITVYGGLDQIPVFAKGGAIVPLAPRTAWGGTGNPETLEVHIFPSHSNRFELYEDDGETTTYQHGHFCLTTFELKVRDRGVDFSIDAGQGDVSVVPQQRMYRLIFQRVTPPAALTVIVNGAAHETTSRYDEDSQRCTIEVIAAPSDRVEIAVRPDGESWLAQNDRRELRFRQMLRTFRMESDTKRWIDQYRAEIFEDPDQLKEFGAAVKDAHLAALWSVLESGRL
jgi:hypothetical protein